MSKITMDLKSETALVEIAEQIKELRGGKKQVHDIPVELREKIIELSFKPNLSLKLVAERIGINDSTIQKWHRKGKKKTKGKRGRPRGSKSFRPIKVVESCEIPIRSPSQTLVLELPGGARVHGLSIYQLHELIQGGMKS